MRRRQFVALLAGATAWPLAAGAQGPRKWRVGFLHPGNSEYVKIRILAFREGFVAAGVGGETDVEIVPGLAKERFDELPAIAAELVGRGLQAICAVSPPAVRAAQAATRSVPIVAMDLESDPIANGWAASLARPGGNVTGIFLDFPDFTAKCLQLLREALPALAKLAVLWHPATGDLQLGAARSAAAALGVAVDVFEVARVADFEPAFRRMVEARVDGLLMLSSPLIGGNPEILAELALEHRLAAITIFPEFAEKGGLIGYGPDLQGLFAQAGTLTRKALQGAAVAELPVERPTRFKLVANLKAARAIGVPLPTSILLRADEVIE